MADEPTRHEYRSGHDPRTLRDALGCFATGVTVVTCLTPDGSPAGLTVNSFTSVSLDPPLLLVCLAKPAASANALIEASHFAVNVLQTGQQPASIRFSTRDEDRFGTTPWSCGEAGAPILADSLGVFECERFAVPVSVRVHRFWRAPRRQRFDQVLMRHGWPAVSQNYLEDIRKNAINKTVSSAIPGGKETFSSCTCWR